jgi:EPS-associated MarR family transcriptional regulator
LKLLEANPQINQRQLASELGISLGRVNYCLKALIEKGMVKAVNFHNSKSKKAYIYKLTPIGIEEKVSVTMRFLRIKMNEYEKLATEINELRAEAQQSQSDFLPKNTHKN